MVNKRFKHESREFSFSSKIGNSNYDYKESISFGVDLEKELQSIEKAKTYSDMFLDALKKHLRNQIRNQRQKELNKFYKKVKKTLYVRADKKSKEYKYFNKYNYWMYSDEILSRSFDGMRVYEAWKRLIKCWDGFYLSKRLGDNLGMIHYAKGILRYSYLLELVQFDFSNLGIKKYTMVDEMRRFNNIHLSMDENNI